ncbi:hypothetical protein V7S43_006175 [Phytophthora oleae]|uniref:Uncharacterized protein n=1 Tax=Phytophthora oleae TaxID=2107226 RepID=A0ABD3FR07_9STRA
MVHIAEPVECLLIPGTSGEFVLGNDLLCMLWIDVERLMDLLAIPLADEVNDDEFDDAVEPTVDYKVVLDEKIRTDVLELVETAIQDGFSREFKKRIDSYRITL